jgi:uncharacterized protein YdeI (BOF family)
MTNENAKKLFEEFKDVVRVDYKDGYLEQTIISDFYLYIDKTGTIYIENEDYNGKLNELKNYSESLCGICLKKDVDKILNEALDKIKKDKIKQIKETISNLEKELKELEGNG